MITVRLQPRLATPADDRAVIAVIDAAYAQYEDELPPELYRRWRADLTDLEARRDDSVTLVVERGGAVLGCIAFYADASRESVGWAPTDAGIRALAVAPAARGSGVGRLLTRECIHRAGVAGAAGIALHTADFMPAARALYESLGFCRRPDHDFSLGSFFGVRGGKAVVALAYRRGLRP